MAQQTHYYYDVNSLQITYAFSTISVKISAGFFVETDELEMEMQNTQSSQNNFGKEQSWRTNTTWFQASYKTTEIKTVDKWINETE